MTGIIPTAHTPNSLPSSAALKCIIGTDQHSGLGIALNSQATPSLPHVYSVSPSTPPCPYIPMQISGQNQKTQSGLGMPWRRGRKPSMVLPAVPDVLIGYDFKSNTHSEDKSGGSELIKKENNAEEFTNVLQEQKCQLPDVVPGAEYKIN